MEPIIKIENLSKQYRLGTIGTGTIKKDMQRWYARVRGKEDPFLKIGESNDRSTKGNSEFVWALRDINLEVMPGEVLGIIGKNGAGKSTLLKILSKVTGPTTGSISFNGRIGSLLEVGTGFHGELTGRENIFLNGAILGMTKQEIRAKLDEIVDFSGCERYIDTPVKRYSSGMTVRLGFAVAAHLEPEILVVDEVLAVGDAEFQKKAIGKMQDVSKNDGRTVLFVSHNMASIENLCTTGVVLENGTSIFKGTQNEAIDKYLNSKNNITEDYSTLQNRKGSQLATITKINLRGTNNEIIDAVLTGQTFEIEFEYEMKQDKIIEAYPGIAIKNHFDVPLVLHHSRLENKKIKLSQDKNKFKLIINRLPLLPSKYYITVSIIGEDGYIDMIENAIQLNVIEGDFYNSGEIAPSSHGTFLIDATWK